MNKYVYSPSDNSFYAVSLRSLYEQQNTWPSDAVNVSNEMSFEFMAEPPDGKIRTAGDDGLPAWGDIPPPTHDELIAQAESEKQSRIAQANEYMNGKQWPGKAAMGRLSDAEKSQYNAWLDYLDALEAIDTSSAPDVSWPAQPAM
ncbi:tail fiber assembly protein [Escherichia coli]